MRFRFNSIRLKLQFIVLITTLAALTFSLIGNVAGDVWELRRNTEAAAEKEARQLAHVVSPALRGRHNEQAAEYLRSLLPDVHAAALYDADGRLFTSFSQPGHAAHIPLTAGEPRLLLDDHELTLVRPIGDSAEHLGSLYLDVEYDTYNTIVEDVEIALAVSLVALTLAMLMIARLEKLVTQPIVAAAEMARQVVEQSDYSPRAQRLSDDEVGVLADSLNRMLDVIELRDAELKASSAGLEQRVRERTNELLEAKASAEQANHAKSAFLSSMSHELRTPLNAILGFAQLLEAEGQAQEHRKEFTSYILKSGRHLLTLINEILDLAQVESGKTSISTETVALNELLYECEAMMAATAGKRSVVLHFPQCALAVRGDRTRLKQVLLNLLSNAVKYNRHGGAVYVECQSAPNGKVRIQVRDTGTGLDAQQMQSLFEPFNRLGQEAGAEEGTGIGLVVTKRLVELMNGAIGAASMPGQGSTFWIELDAASTQVRPEQDAGVVAQTIPAAVQANIQSKLLCIEDNAVNMRLLEEIVRLSPSLRMIAAGDAILGIQLARTELPDAILLDIQLPGMSGFEAMDILRSDPKTASIPVIALTASAMAGDVEAARQAGFFRYLTKPLDLSILSSALNDALETRLGEPT